MRTNAWYYFLELKYTRVQRGWGVQIGGEKGLRVASLHLAGREMRQGVPQFAATVEKSLANSHGVRVCHSLLVCKEQVKMPNFLLKKKNKKTLNK